MLLTGFSGIIEHGMFRIKISKFIVGAQLIEDGVVTDMFLVDYAYSETWTDKK